MQKNLLHIFLKRVSENDPEATRQVPQKLAERLMYVPIVSSDQSSTDSSVIKLKARKITKPDKDETFICFSNQRFFKEWASTNSHGQQDVVSILLGDFCTAVLETEENAKLTVDLGVDHSVTFAPHELRPISKYVSPLFFEMGTPQTQAPIAKITESETPTFVGKANKAETPVAETVTTSPRPKKSGFFGFLKR